MSLWRFGRGWPESALQSYLSSLKSRVVNFDVPLSEMTAENGWLVDGADGILFEDSPGMPQRGGPYARAKQALLNYDFSDPRIVMGHFDPRSPFVGRDMLLEIKVFGFRFLNGVRVHSVKDVTEEGKTIFGFRYDTLQGHIERGFEWFLLTKDHNTGAVRFKIEAHWRPGDFPNWWMRLGFFLLAGFYRHLWRQRALKRLRRLAFEPSRQPIAEPGQLAHRGDETPTRTAP